MQQNNNYNYQVPPQAPSQQQPPMQPPIQPRTYIPIVKNTKSKFLTFVFSLVPGAGQMYQGLLKKGISIMLLFFGVIAVSAITYMGALSIVLPVIWFYSFFDTINRINMSVDELRLIEDKYIFMEGKMPKNKQLQHLFEERHLIIGWGLIVLAIWIFLHMIINSQWLYTLMGDRAFNIIYDSVNHIPSIIIPIVCVFIGVKLIKGSSKGNQQSQYSVPVPPEPPVSGNEENQ